MPSLFEALLMTAIIAFAWFWYDSRRAAEIAIRVCERVCREMNVQLLDQTVAIAGLGLGRGTDGRIRILRRLRFLVSLNGVDRYTGGANMIGTHVESVRLDLPDGTTFVTPQSASVHSLH